MNGRQPMQIELQPYQFDFLYSKKRYPAFVGGWGVGKTLLAISRGLIYSKAIPNNLGIIFRKTARSLFDSTLKDYERYTKRKVDSNRNDVFPNGSITMFRHIDEIGEINQQNINLGWFYIEQGEELDSDKEFFMLFGRLRRELEPSEEFKKLELPVRSGWVIANAGDHWMKPLWKDGRLEDAELIEATTWDNAKNLPKDFLDSLKTLEKTKPEMYKQYVLNDWAVSQDQFILIKPELIESLKGIVHHRKEIRRVIACDPATGGDECVIYVLENTRVIDELILHYRDAMKIVGEIMVLSNKWKVDDIGIDSIGIGKPMADRLRELGKRVLYIDSAETADDDTRFNNRRTEMWWYVMEQMQAGEIDYFEDYEIKKQLTAVRYKVLDSKGKVKLKPKEETKKILGQSPDRADAFVYGQWALSKVQPMSKDRWREAQRVFDVSSGVTSAMVA